MEAHGNASQEIHISKLGDKGGSWWWAKAKNQKSTNLECIGQLALALTILTSGWSVAAVASMSPAEIHSPMMWLTSPSASLIDVLRRPAADRFVRAGSWPVKGEFPLGSKVGGKRGIVGLGALVQGSKHNWLVGKEVLTALGKEGIVINVGRGLLVDEKELVVQFLKRGEIGGAGLDVYENEPMCQRNCLG
ncbi:hypothetical protein HAX54_015032 [Datura stramonium]|uniref:D-isomer specific 2-hydroxyacid dehydrogenase NAD-binding domain-containing protein n=1 Tax=Datura stramonium TaxID=4076 RepID=A0ABS8RZ56_DATST|nr:hypothetical protein [Datura stramonium]